MCWHKGMFCAQVPTIHDNGRVRTISAHKRPGEIAHFVSSSFKVDVSEQAELVSHFRSDGLQRGEFQGASPCQCTTVESWGSLHNAEQKQTP